MEIVKETNNDPGFLKALSELHEEFPGAAHDDSLENYQRNQRKKKIKNRIIKKIIFKIIFHGVFYSLFAAGIYFLFRKQNISLFTSMTYALTWFLACIVFCGKFTEDKK